MSGFVFIVADVLLAAMTAAGVCYSLRVRELFRGDPMQRTSELTIMGLATLGIFTLTDFVIQATNQGIADQFPFLLAAAIVAVAVILVAQIGTVRWASLSEEERTRSS